MANILALKRRIQAARNVSKTTKAMQMIAASKLKRAQDQAASGKPYVEKISKIMNNLLLSEKKYKNPYFSIQNNIGKTLVIVLSPDKGLCGSLVTNLIREFINFQEQTPDSTYIVMGKKLEGQITHFSKEILASFPFGTTIPSFNAVYPLLRLINEYYLGGKVDSVKIISMEFINIFTQKPKVFDLLPIIPEINENDEKEDNFYLYEPNKKILLDSLIEHYIEMTIYQRLLESFVSEQASRMMSMQNATDSARDIIDSLQLEYNKTRQAKITGEILDITGGQSVLENE